jgi:hypothetical protein
MAGHPIQVRFNCLTSCGQGGLGGTSNQMILSRGGGGVFSVGATTTTYVGAFDMLGGGTYKTGFRARIAAGDTWGAAMVDHHPFADIYRAMYYGDLSLPAMAGPANKAPVVTGLSASPTSGVAPLKVTLSATASDADGTITSTEWYPEGYHYGAATPTVNSATSHAHTFVLPYRYLAEVQVVDNYKARAWKAQQIVVKPTPAQPLRIQCGTVKYSQLTYWLGAGYTDTKGYAWLHDQKYVKGDGTWGLELVKGEKEGTISGDNNIDNTQDDELFKHYRFVRAENTLTYRLPLGNGTFTIWAGFAEPKTDTAVGSRLIDVDLEGQPWLVAFDIRAKAGAGRRAIFATKSVTVTDGEVTVAVRRNAASSLDAVLNCLAVFPGAGQGTQPPDGGATTPAPPDSGSAVPDSGTGTSTPTSSPDAGTGAPPPPPPPPPPSAEEENDDDPGLLLDPDGGPAWGWEGDENERINAAVPASEDDHVLEGGCSLGGGAPSGSCLLILLALVLLGVVRRSRFRA